MASQGIEWLVMSTDSEKRAEAHRILGYYPASVDDVALAAAYAAHDAATAKEKAKEGSLTMEQTRTKYAHLRKD